jgi:hypothetical protein
MKRWFIARMGDYENEGTRVPATNKYKPDGTLRADLYADPTAPSRIWSKPGFDWCFGQVAASSMTAMQADPDIAILPDATLDAAFSSLPLAVRNAAITRITNAGFDVSAIKSVWTIRQILVHLLKQLQPALNSVEQGDIADAT